MAGENDDGHVEALAHLSMKLAAGHVGQAVVHQNDVGIRAIRQRDERAGAPQRGREEDIRGNAALVDFVARFRAVPAIKEFMARQAAAREKDNAV